MIKPLTLVIATSLLSTASYAHYQCGPKVNYDLNYHANYRSTCPQKRTKYKAFTRDRLHKDHSVDHCANYGKLAADRVDSKIKHDQRGCHQHCSADRCHSHTYAVTHHNAMGKRSQYSMSYSPSHLRPFDSIMADGNTQVIINGGKSRSVTISSKTSYPTELIDVEVRNGTLFLSRHAKRSWKNQAHQTIIVNVTMPNIRHITLKDFAGVTGYNIRANRGLCINSSSGGTSKLQGVINLKQLIQTGPGKMEIQWVDSDRLRVIASSQSCIKLSGTVDMIEVRATDRTHVDAKYLRAHKALVQTGDMAVVDITAIDALSGFASDFSNIKYYKTPKYLTRHTYASGNVLQMRYWN